MLKTLTICTISEDGKSFSTSLTELLPGGTDVSRLIIEKFEIKDYSSSASTALALRALGPLGELVHGVRYRGPKGCVCVLMPFGQGQPYQGESPILKPAVVGDASSVAQKYSDFVKRENTGYNVDRTAPFAHRLQVEQYAGTQIALHTTEQDLIKAMMGHEAHDKIVDLSNGLELELIPLEKSELGPVRLVLSLVVTILPDPRRIFKRTPGVLSDQEKEIPLTAASSASSASAPQSEFQSEDD